jgi:predicted dehydrogenase
MDAMKPVTVGIVGLGWWGRKIVTALSGRAAGIRIVSAVEPNLSAARDFAADFALELTERLDAVLGDPRIEAVILATPHDLHGQQIEAVVRARKHVFCEKPIALTGAGARRAVRMTTDAGLVLATGHERRFEPPLIDLLAQAEAGRLGRLLQIEANFSHDRFLSLDRSNWRLDPAQAPAAGMTATGIHLTDLAVRLLGAPQDVRVVCENHASDLAQGDTLSAHIRFRRGGTAYISASLAMPFYSRFAAFGTKGWVDIRDKAHLEAPAGWVVARADAQTGIAVEEVPPSEAVSANFEAFAKAIRGVAPYPIGGEDIIQNAALLEAIVRAAKSGAIEPVN